MSRCPYELSRPSYEQKRRAAERRAPRPHELSRPAYEQKRRAAERRAPRPYELSRPANEQKRCTTPLPARPAGAGRGRSGIVQRACGRRASTHCTPVTVYRFFFFHFLQFFFAFFFF